MDDSPLHDRPALMSCRFRTVWLIRLSSTINTCSVPLPSMGVVTFVLREDDRLMANEEEGEVADIGLRGEDSTRAAMAEGGATARVLMKNRKTWETAFDSAVYNG